ncbi:MAG TPA: hypothetical protein PLT68_10505 [Actinomycetota bacterium]|nr:hypothetical protein [Actinomycetota bacterium]
MYDTGGDDPPETDPDAVPLTAAAAFRMQLRENPVIWVLFVFMALMLIPIQRFTPLAPPYSDADTWVAVIATLLVALAFDARLDVTWLFPVHNRREAIHLKEWIGAFTMMWLILIASGLLVGLYMTGWHPEDAPVPDGLSFLPVAAVGAELFLLMLSFYLRASNPATDD